ncbi:MAG: hypothetical protein A3G34_14460 [Candidatus Lindowbacteria bacterium RIFCSPLOWO2_12_FULL_62_27]|nr:MAG: hypothetical protein A3I06_16935 [Candidatus Lindowbacteria bacterium RIFCSPLOWO2_02_FULL_62_12]OGH62763.1 MAG: hypothetical protein A3G34_14460 [Candidatus Lindowbacteria bacterium RIFCSPLOWO2_12_FULL_62_27]
MYLKLNPGKTIRDYDRECFTKEPVRMDIYIKEKTCGEVIVIFPVEELTLPQIQMLLGPSALPGTGPYRLSREQCIYMDQFLGLKTNPELHTEAVIRDG